MLDKTYKNPTYIEVSAELKKQEPTFNGEIYHFDELIKTEKTLKIIEFIKEQLILILETDSGKKVAIQLIEGEKDYFASVINVNSHTLTTGADNKRTFNFDKISEIKTLEIEEDFYNRNYGKDEKIKIKVLYFIGEKDGKKAYIIRRFEGKSDLLLNYLNKTYTTYESDFSTKLPSIEEFLNKKKTDSIENSQFNIMI